MTSGGQCVITPGTTLMLLWSASSWDMHTLEVRTLSDLCGVYHISSIRHHGYYFFRCWLMCCYCLRTVFIYFFGKPNRHQ